MERSRFSSQATKNKADQTQWHFMTYKVFCINFGAHSTKSEPWHDWNAEATELMTENWSSIWQRFTTAADGYMDMTADFLRRFFDDVADSALDAGKYTNAVCVTFFGFSDSLDSTRLAICTICHTNTG
jgi:hypothetical protein